MTADSMIDYETLAQEAMRGVVRSVLVDAAKKGLPGDHHFYISFDTLAPGVVLSKRLREKYAEEMTIVLQHRFWDLIVSEARFEVKLTFDGIPERLVIPFKAIRVFFDPSVRYGLQFESVQQASEAGSAGPDEIDTSFDDPFADRNNRAPRPVPVPLKRDRRGPPTIKPAATKPTPSRPADIQPVANQTTSPAALEATGTDETDGSTKSGADIVSLDAFRKK